MLHNKKSGYNAAHNLYFKCSTKFEEIQDGKIQK